MGADGFARLTDLAKDSDVIAASPTKDVAHLRDGYRRVRDIRDRYVGGLWADGDWLFRATALGERAFVVRRD